MSEPVTVSNTPPSDPDDILVALEHARLVESVLVGSGVAQPDTEPSEALALARIPLPNPEGVRSTVAGGISRVLAQTEGNFDEKSVHDAETRIRQQMDSWGAPRTPVEEVLQRLRAYFTLRYTGWVPTMGKNRLVGQVTGGGGTISHGGGPAPVPAGELMRSWEHFGRGITVGVLDTAIDRHSWFAGSVLAKQNDFLKPAATRDFAAGHGTFVTGVVLQQAPGATVRARAVLADAGSAESWAVAKEIVEIGRSGVQILNLSFVCYTEDRRAPLVLATAVDRLDPEILVVACSGNHGDPELALREIQRGEPAWPAALDDVVAVGSARKSEDKDGVGHKLSEITPPDAAWIDLLTDGENVTSTYFTGRGERPADAGYGGVVGDRNFGGWACWTGTSFSAAKVSGKVAATAEQEKVSPRTAYHLIMQGLRRYGPEHPPFLDL